MQPSGVVLQTLALNWERFCILRLQPYPHPRPGTLGKACRSDRLSSKGEVPLVTQWAEARHAKNPTIHKKLRQRIENYLKMTIMPRLRNSVIDKELCIVFAGR